jgi:hypothetical protein
MDIEKLEARLAVKYAEAKEINKEIALIQNTITLLTCTDKDDDCKWLDNILDVIK